MEVDMMTHITKIAAVETATAIWEYDPSLPDNCMLNSSLDVTAAIQALAIKVGHVSFLLSWFSNLPQIQSSGQHIEAFEKLQVECSLNDTLKIPLHSNVQWEWLIACSVYCTRFVRYADVLYPSSSLSKGLVGHHLVYCRCWPSIQSYHNYPTWWAGRKTLTMVSFHLIWDRLGTGVGSVQDSCHTWS